MGANQGEVELVKLVLACKVARALVHTVWSKQKCDVVKTSVDHVTICDGSRLYHLYHFDLDGMQIQIYFVTNSHMVEI